jgi:hemolysin activation/secretion protein
MAARMAAALAALLVPAILMPALAQAPPPQQAIIERVRPAAPPRLAPRAEPPEEGRATGPGEDSIVHVARARLQGNTALPEARLRAAIEPLQGRAVTLARIEEARLAVLRAYRMAGYPYTAVTARLAPAGDGAAELLMHVTEGFVRDVRLEGSIGRAAAQVLRFLRPLAGQGPLRADALERALLLASDVPGVSLRGVLRPVPGEAGALDLVALVSHRPVSGSLNVDNRGYRLTGPWQGLLVLGLNALTALGERTELALLEAEGHTQSFGQLSHEAFLGGSGLRLRLYLGTGQARPGSELAAIGYVGGTWAGGLGLSYPAIRSREANLTLGGQFDLFDGATDTAMTRSRDRVRALRLGAEGAVRDTLLPWAAAAASTSGLLRVSQGVAAFGASRDGSGEVARQGSEFGFTKLTGEVTRTQPLLRPLDDVLVGVQATLAGQWTDAVLPASEKFYLGGARLGRGFYSGQVTGDRALAAALELQVSTTLGLPPLGLAPGSGVATQAYLFHDVGQTGENLARDPDRRLSSWGGGVRFLFDDALQLDLEVARRITRSPDGTGAALRRLDETAVFGRVLVRF